MPASVFAVIGDLLLGPVGRAAKLNCDNRKLLPGWPAGLELDGYHTESERQPQPPARPFELKPDVPLPRPKSQFCSASDEPHSKNAFAAAHRRMPRPRRGLNP